MRMMSKEIVEEMRLRILMVTVRRFGLYEYLFMFCGDVCQWRRFRFIRQPSYALTRIFLKVSGFWGLDIAFRCWSASHGV